MALVLVASLTLGAPTWATAQSSDSSNQVARRKALLIEQFTRLIEWPESALQDGQPFVVCVVGHSQTAEELIQLSRWRQFKGRPGKVRRATNGDGLRACHVVYVAPTDAPKVKEMLESIGQAPVLVVGDSPGFVERGGHLNLVEEQRAKPKPGTYVGFELNAEVVKQSSLSFDPQLLSHARNVHSTAQGGPAGGP